MLFCLQLDENETKMFPLGVISTTSVTAAQQGYNDRLFFFNSMAMRFDAHDWNGTAAQCAAPCCSSKPSTTLSDVCVCADFDGKEKDKSVKQSPGLVFYKQTPPLFSRKHRQIYYYTERADASATRPNSSLQIVN